jgi:hypothetical protein
MVTEMPSRPGQITAAKLMWQVVNFEIRISKFEILTLCPMLTSSDY